MWLALFNALLQLALVVLRQVERKQQLEAAKKEVLVELQRKVNELTDDVQAAIDRVSHDPADVVRDPANRDQYTPGSGTGSPPNSV